MLEIFVILKPEPGSDLESPNSYPTWKARPDLHLYYQASDGKFFSVSRGFLSVQLRFILFLDYQNTFNTLTLGRVLWGIRS